MFYKIKIVLLIIWTLFNLIFLRCAHNSNNIHQIQGLLINGRKEGLWESDIIDQKYILLTCYQNGIAQNTSIVYQLINDKKFPKGANI